MSVEPLTTFEGSKICALMSANAKAAVEALELVDGDEDAVTGITSIVVLDDERRAV